MKLLQSFFLFLLITALFFACKPKYVKETINQVDSLYEIVDSCNKVIVENSIDTLNFYYNFIHHDNLIFKSKLFDFPEDKELTKVFTNYFSIEKGFKGLIKSHTYLKADIKTSLNQLKNFKHDLDKGLIMDPDSVQTYYLKEKEAVDLIKSQTKLVVDRLQDNILFFYEVYPKMEEFKEAVKHNFPEEEFSKL